MPELPEVETVRRGLAPRLTGHAITQVETRRADLRFPFPPDFAARIAGRHVENVGRRAKYLLIELQGGLILLSHLGMSGRYSFDPDGPPGPHDHVQFQLDDGTRVVYTDPRRFGFMDLMDTAHMGTNRFLKTLGIEPLGNILSGDVLTTALHGRRTPIKAALLDQRIVAGIGNIYACEALFRAGISPRRQAHTITGKRAERLADAIRTVLQDAIAAGGSTLRDFTAADGELGYFQHGFEVYGREDQPCVAPECPARVRRIVQSGRSTFFCSTCQR